MDKLSIIKDLHALISHLQSDDIEGLIRDVKVIGIDKNSSLIVSYMKDIVIEDIKNHILRTTTPLRIKRKGEYGIETTDVYTLKDNVLYRNGHDTKWSTFGKLYQAYKLIH